MKKKKLLVLGGIAVLVDIVAQAQKNGYYVIVTDYLTNSPAKKIADESWMLSIDDVSGIVQKCIEEKVDGVMNYCLDPGQKPYQEICERLKIPCVASFEQFEIMTNKDKFAKACNSFGIDTIPEYNLDDYDNMQFPVMVKPVDSRASKGLVVCHKKEELNEAYEYALAFSKRKKLRIEKYLNGYPEICAKYIAVDGEIFFTSMADVFTCYLENGQRVYLGTQTYPSRYYKEYLETVNDRVIKMLKKIGIKNGATSFTGFYDHGKFRFFDPSLRMGGAQDWCIGKAASGVDISDLLTNFAITGSMGNVENIRPIDKAFAKKYSALLYFDVIPGTIAVFEGIKDAIKVNGVVGFHQCHVVGDTVKSLGTSDNVAIRFIVSCDTKKEFVETVRKIQEKIIINNEKGENMIAPMFDPELITE